MNNMNTEYEEHATMTKMLHVIYMDDMKLADKKEEELQK